MLRYLDTDHDEQEALFRCSECRKIVANGSTCCPPAPFWDHLERMTADEYREHCERKTSDE